MNRRSFLAAGAAQAAFAQSAPYQIGAYYFPNFHVDPRNEKIHGPGWTEWELLKRAEPRFKGHRQPKRPLWGYEDESDPRVFARKIDAAADHGLTHFIFDWYWFNDGPFLERGLERGYLGAANRQRLRFSLMWANHDWVDIQPAKRGVRPPLLYPGQVTRETFERMTDYIVSRYFQQSSYWTIDGRPYFSIYELYRLIEGLGGIEPTIDALRSFRRKTQAAGFPDLHLNAVVWGVKILPNEKTLTKPAEILKALAVDSVTSYVWIHDVPLDRFPETPYAAVAAKVAQKWEQAATEFGVPYHPNVTMGWDSSPRTVQTDAFTNSGYPFTAILSGNTPDAFRDSLITAKRFLDRNPAQPKILTINAWNEWTEGSYLEPDTESRMGYLEAIRSVFLK